MKVVRANEAWLSGQGVPKLSSTPTRARSWEIERGLVRSWPNQMEVTVPGIHFIQEDSGPEIGKAIADWLRSL